MHVFRTVVHNLFGSATESHSTDPLGVYNTCLRQLFDSHAPLVTRTVTDRTSASWMTLGIRQPKVQRPLAERKWHESGLTVHREIYVKQCSLVSNMISKVKRDYLCHKIVNGGSSQELLRLSSQMMGKSEILCAPLTFSPRLSLISLMISLCIRLKRSKAALTLIDQSPLTLLSSLERCLHSFNL